MNQLSEEARSKLQSSGIKSGKDVCMQCLNELPLDRFL